MAYTDATDIFDAVGQLSKEEKDIFYSFAGDHLWERKKELASILTTQLADVLWQLYLCGVRIGDVDRIAPKLHTDNGRRFMEIELKGEVIHVYE